MIAGGDEGNQRRALFTFQLSKLFADPGHASSPCSLSAQ
jgi:hypothetical protein